MADTIESNVMYAWGVNTAPVVSACDYKIDLVLIARDRVSMVLAADRHGNWLPGEQA